ncbi:MAG: NADPH-dependent glutamate synthase [Pseudomonadota bacterium]
MNFEIIEKKLLADKTYKFKVYAPLIAKKRQPGQFIIITPFPRGERIPITLAGSDDDEGTITFVIQTVGKTTSLIAAHFNEGDAFFGILGPLGEPSHIKDYKTAICIGGGYGTAAIIPIAKALKEAGNKVISIIGAREKTLLIMEEELKACSDELYISTNDGSKGKKGFVTDVLNEIIQKEKIGVCFGIGPVPMMKACSDMTKPHEILTYVSLNAIMVDGTGMCASCRVEVDGTVKFACFHGPDFDGHKVNFEELIKRQTLYKEQEKVAFDRYIKEPTFDSSPISQKLELKGTAVDNCSGQCNSPVSGISVKDRMAIEKQKMPEQEPNVRNKNFDEVNLGYSVNAAMLEAARCIQCKNPACIDGCPVKIDIPKFIKKIEDGNFIESLETMKEANSLPAICGRVCPQEEQCEKYCVLGKKREPVSIGRLERFIADYGIRYGDGDNVEKPNLNGKKVAIVGSGPAGLTAAGELAKLGYEVKVYEALHMFGGVLIYGIPEFRLPNEIVSYEIEYLKKLGVEFEANALIGRISTLDELLESGFDMVFLGTGAGLPWMLNIPGENLGGVYTANEFLTRINMMRANKFPEYDTPITVGKKVAVLGAGNTAMDAARTSIRMGASEVSIVYRRTRHEAPARNEEILHAEEEGVKFLYLTAPTKFIGNEDNLVTHMEVLKMELGEPDSSGRRRPVPVAGSETKLEVDTVISALGFGVNPLIPSMTKDLETDKWGVVIVDATTGKTSKDKVYAGGDVITGGATVILAMGQAKVAVESMHKEMMKK